MNPVQQPKRLLIGGGKKQCKSRNLRDTSKKISPKEDMVQETKNKEKKKKEQDKSQQCSVIHDKREILPRVLNSPFVLLRRLFYVSSQQPFAMSLKRTLFTGESITFFLKAAVTQTTFSFPWHNSSRQWKKKNSHL